MNSIDQPDLPLLLQQFLYDITRPDGTPTAADLCLTQFPDFLCTLRVHHSAVGRFYAPRDLCEAGGMYRQRIRSCPNWQGEYERRDTVLIVQNADLGMVGMEVARVYLFFPFERDDVGYSCALIHWFDAVFARLDPLTGMWTVEPQYCGDTKALQVVHLDSIARAVHLLPCYTHGDHPLSPSFHFSRSLDYFSRFYVSRYSDHHAHEFVV